MRLLLDSHVFLWWKATDPRLSSASEGLTLMTHDDKITRYEVAVLRVP